MNQVTFLAVVAAATLRATAQTTMSDGALCDSIQISSSDDSLQVSVSPRYVVTTQSNTSGELANFTIDEWGTLKNEGVGCRFMPFLACLPQAGLMDTGFFVEDDSAISLGDDTTFWLCNPDVLLYEYPDLVVDVREVILDNVAGPVFAEMRAGSCEEISFRAKKDCGADAASDESDQDGGVTATTTASGPGSFQSSAPSSASSLSSSPVSPTSTTSQIAAVEDSTNGVSRETGSLSMAFLGLILAVAAEMWVT